MSDGSAIRRALHGWSARLRRLPPAGVDAALTVLALAGQVTPFLATTRSDGRPWTAAEFLPVLLVSLPVLGRRYAPIVCLLISAAGIGVYAVVGSEGPEQPIWYGALMLMYAVADRAPQRQRRITLVLAAVGITVIGGVFGSLAVGIREAILWGAAYALGRSAELHRENTTMLEERAARVARERAVETERAAERERARIARDMHDILAHAVSLMVVQAEAGAAAGAAVPGRTEAIFDAIAEAGRDAMTQLRRTLGLLAEPDLARAPQPTLARLPDLVAGVGLHGTLQSSGTPRALPPDVEVAVYRIVQEALTNVIKHADAESVVVGLRWEDAELRISVVDDGAHAAVPGEDIGSGAGLIGIRERAAACGGSARFGPRVGANGFEVAARIPTP
ncbi:histidine kinase [Microbacterium sp. LWO13-1.2]|uniref:sensor histidine kinase n=1 Tax=Microbacterium sp. LWO13-1.2 TaxID=3135262 RepID=UPI0031390156